MRDTSRLRLRLVESARMHGLKSTPANVPHPIPDCPQVFARRHQQRGRSGLEPPTSGSGDQSRTPHRSPNTDASGSQSAGSGFAPPTAPFRCCYQACSNSVANWKPLSASMSRLGNAIRWWGVLEEQGSQGSALLCGGRQDAPARDDIARSEVLPNPAGERARPGYLPSSRFSTDFKWA
jgi:hypothetical protein